MVYEVRQVVSYSTSRKKAFSIVHSFDKLVASIQHKGIHLSKRLVSGFLKQAEGGSNSIVVVQAVVRIPLEGVVIVIVGARQTYLKGGIIIINDDP